MSQSETQFGVGLQRKREQGATTRRQVSPQDIHYLERNADICPPLMTQALPHSVSVIESVPVYSIVLLFDVLSVNI